MGKELAPEKLAERAGAFARFREPQALMKAQQATLAHMAGTLREFGYPRLAQLLTLREGPSLLVLAARYFLRRAVEEDSQLFQGLAFAQLEQVQSGQEQGFAALAHLLNEHGDRLESLLDEVAATVVQTHAAVLDVRQELHRQGEHSRELYQAVLELQGRFDLLRGGLRPRDSLSIRDEAERQLVGKVDPRYRGLPRRAAPTAAGAAQRHRQTGGGGRVVRGGGTRFRGRRGLGARPAHRAERTPTPSAPHSNCVTGPSLSMNCCMPLSWTAPDSLPSPSTSIDWCHPGAGGCGVAFLCEDVQRNEKVVVKTLLDDGLSCGIDQLFTEAEVLGKLDHPGVVRSRGHGFTDPASRSRPYLVMEYFEGVTLETYIREQGPLSFGEWLVLGRQMAEALLTAHRQKILHRDVKPANVLVPRRPGWVARATDRLRLGHASGYPARQEPTWQNDPRCQHRGHTGLRRSRATRTIARRQAGRVLGHLRFWPDLLPCPVSDDAAGAEALAERTASAGRPAGPLRR